MSKNNGKSENKSKDTLFYEGRIKEIELELIDYQLDLARSHSQSESLQKIITSLLLHGKLTQSQIKKLAILSKSTISTGLSNLMNIGHIKKEKIQGSREYTYIISSAYKDSMNNAFGSLDKEIQFLDVKLLELTNKYSTDYKGFSLLSNRIEEVIRVFILYQKLLEKLENDNIEIKNKDSVLRLTKEDIKIIDDIFNPKIKQIEDEIIDFFLYNSAYSTLDEFTLRIFVYFLTRKVLTQKKLRYLTGLSLGKVSQVVNSLIELGMIEKVNKKEMSKIIPADKMRQHFYSMNSIQKGFFRSAINSEKRILQNKTKFEELRSELVANESELKNLNGYENVLEVLDNYFRLVSIFQNAEHLFKELT